MIGPQQSTEVLLFSCPEGAINPLPEKLVQEREVDETDRVGCKAMLCARRSRVFQLLYRIWSGCQKKEVCLHGLHQLRNHEFPGKLSVKESPTSWAAQELTPTG